MTAMDWPSATDYHEAVQNPRSAFADSDLTRATPITDAMGLPRVMSGQFASVYRLSQGTRSWAVRCFLRHVEDRERRYRLVSGKLQSLRLPFFVGFQFLQQGVRVRGRWYPILKMDWLEGENLDAYIRRNLHSQGRLLDLASKWLELASALGKAHIAHGDLQHGNVLVAPDGLKLVDYDGMWIPELAGDPSPELGHANYQLPLRSGDDFGPWLDHFSAWVIYISLIALAWRPDLWNRFNADNDQCLLFARQDFESPELSPLFSELEACPDSMLRQLVGQLHDFTRRVPADVPPLAEQTVARIPRAVVSVSGLPDWIADHVAPLPPLEEGPVAVGEEVRSVDIDWAVEQSQPPAVMQSVEGRLWIERSLVLLYLSLLASLLYWGMSYRTMVPFLLCPILTGLLVLAAVLRYRAMPAVLAKSEALQELRVAERARAGLQEQMAAARRVDGDAERALARTRKEIDRQLSLADAAERNAVESSHRKLDQVLSECRRKRDGLLNALDAELSAALTARRRTHTERFLQSRTVAIHMSVSGIGPGLKSRLMAAGVSTAADVTLGRVRMVRGFGDTRVWQVMNWRRSVETEAQRTMPQRLPASEEQRVRAAHQARIQAIEQNEQTARARATAEQAAAGQAHRVRRDGLAQELRRAQEARRTAREAQGKQLAALRKPEAAANWQVALVRRRLVTYTRVSFALFVAHLFFIGTRRP